MLKVDQALHSLCFEYGVVISRKTVADNYRTLLKGPAIHIFKAQVSHDARVQHGVRVPKRDRLQGFKIDYALDDFSPFDPLDLHFSFYPGQADHRPVVKLMADGIAQAQFKNAEFRIVQLSIHRMHKIRFFLRILLTPRYRVIFYKLIPFFP